MPAATGGQRFVITGLSRLAVRVASQLAARRADVTIVIDHAADEHLADVASRMAGVEVVAGGPDRPAALAAAGLATADGLLALGDDDLDNLRTVACAAALAPDVPVVLRSFDAAVADQLELAPNVRRAFSVSGLAAPAFVAAVLGDRAVQTLRIGREEVPLLRTDVQRSSPLVGKTWDEIRAERDVTVLARSDEAETAWVANSDGGTVIDPRDELLVGGRLIDVFGLALANDPLPTPEPQARGRVLLLDGAEDEAPLRSVTSTLLPATAAGLGALLLGGSIAFGLARDLSPLEALYFTVTTAWGDPAVQGSDPWQQIFGLCLMVSVGALVGVLFSYLAALATEERMASRMGRRAARMQGHVVVAGLGTVGYRIVRLLRQIGVEAVAVDRDAASRFVGAAAAYGPVLTGDVRLPEDLARAGIERAACLVATTDDDLVNITACLQARALNPGIRTVARIFDEAIAESAGSALGIDAVVSASREAAAAFVGAAIDDRASREVVLGDVHLVAMRHTFAGAMPSEAQRAAWRTDGVHILVTDGDSVIVAGPAKAPSMLALLHP